MVKNSSSTQQHIRGNKGNILVSKVKSKNLENVMVVPIEIGKSQHKALIANYFGSLLTPPFEFHNSLEGIRFLHKTITNISKYHQVEEILIGMEATGHYFKKTAAILNEMAYTNLFILNPLSTSYCRKAGLTWSKTDDIDLCAVGQALLSGYGAIYRPEKPLWEDIKEACRYRRFLIKQQTALKNKLHAFFDLLLPGINKVKIFSDAHLWTTASLHFFSKYPDPELIRQLQPKSIVKFFQQRGRRISYEPAYQLIEWANEALNPDSSANACRQFVFKELIKKFEQLLQDISKIELKLTGYLVQIPAVLLLSIDQIGPVRAAEFAGEITPLEQYPKSLALIKAAGLDSTRHQSASSESSKRPISKKGSRRLRYITIQVANALMKNNQYFAPVAKELIAKGKSKDCACVATATRFMRVAFHMINNQTTFQPHNALGISKNPLHKIKAFLQNHHASELTEEYIAYAKKYFTTEESTT